MDRKGTESNPIQLDEVTVYGKRPSLFKIGAKKLIDELTLNSNNSRVNNVRRNPHSLEDFQIARNIGEGLNYMSLGTLNRLSPAQNVRFLYDIFTGENILDSHMGNAGITSNEFAKKYPTASFAINTLFDLGVHGINSTLSDGSPHPYEPKIIAENRPGRYFRWVGENTNPLGDMKETGVVRSKMNQVIVGYAPDGEPILMGKQFPYPMFGKNHVWYGSTAKSGKNPSAIIRSKSNTGDIVWEKSLKDFNHKGHAGIYRPKYNGDLQSAPAKYFDYLSPVVKNGKVVGYYRMPTTSIYENTFNGFNFPITPNFYNRKSLED